MSDALNNLPPLRDVIARYDLGARRSLGQHFLLDLNITNKIARHAGDLTTGTTIEVGPGPGGLTRALLTAGAAHLIAVEKDARCHAALEEIAAVSDNRLEILAADALEVPFETLGEQPRRIIANLPYNISTQLLMNWLKALASDPSAFSYMVLMFQKEVAMRLLAEPRSKDYGRLSVMTQWLTSGKLLFDLPPRAFTPAPKVTSSVVALTPRPSPLAPARQATLEAVTAAAFGQRRKMLRQSLKSLGVPVGPLIADAGVAETQRAEELDVPQFCALARALDELKAV